MKLYIYHPVLKVVAGYNGGYGVLSGATLSPTDSAGLPVYYGGGGSAAPRSSQLHAELTQFINAVCIICTRLS